MSKYGSYDDSPILAELYDLVPGYQQLPDQQFYLPFAAEAPGRVLELACGTGRISIPIAEAGGRITGLDLSEHMLARCRQKLRNLPQEVRDRIHLVQSSMTDFSLDDSFDLVIAPFHAFQHLIDVEDQLACLRNINRHLTSKGKLIIDVFQVNLGVISKPPIIDEVEDFETIDLPDGRRLRRTHRIPGVHTAEQYRDVELIYYLTDPSGTTERFVQAFPYRYFFRYELVHLLERCGFKIIDLFGNFDKSPLHDKSPEMIFVVEKMAEVG